LSNHLWVIFIVDTILIAGGSYVINDIFDHRADLINKPNKLYIGEGRLSPSDAKRLYGIITVLGFLLAIYIAYRIEKIHLVMIYPVAVGMLYYYSSRWKKIALVGNVVVAIFCGFVPGILLYAEWDHLLQLRDDDLQTYTFIIDIFTAYIVFAFMSTIVRELIKDVEDVIGDKAAGYRTLPVLIGTRYAKYTIVFLMIMFVCSFQLWIGSLRQSAGHILANIIIGIFVLSTLAILFKLIVANKKEHYSELSKWMKLIMIFALFVFLCIPFI